VIGAVEQRRAILRDDAGEPFAGWRRASVAPPDDLIAEVERSGLRGRGGAGFPTARKFAMTRASAGARRYVVVNGAEDEPGSGKDQFLLTRRPELVVEGAMLAAHAVGADAIVFYLSDRHPAAVAATRRAIAVAGPHGLAAAALDDQRAGAAGALSASVVLSPPTYVAGEDSAALEVLEGREALPREKPPYPVEAGLFAAPTLVANVETLAVLPRIVVLGGAWYRSLGTADSPGTMLFTLGDEMAVPGIHEVELGTPLRELVEFHGGGLRNGRPVRAVLPGGPSSGFLAADQLDVALEHRALRDAGSALGCGVVRVLDDRTCVVEILEELMGFFATESCGQCPACRMETGLLARLVGQVRAGAGTPVLLDKLPEVLDFAATKGGLCSLIAMPDPPVRSALARFRGDFEHHLEHGCCPPLPPGDH
jgi:NADH:ubiquinone oxidoreductase subunit F (NADH-binding)